MKHLSKYLTLSLAASALLLAGCSKKPLRPDPGASQMGTQTDEPTINPYDVALPSDIPTTLEQRGGDGILEDDLTIRGLLEAAYFDFDRSAVPTRERPKIEAAVKYLKENPDKRMLLEGHCDWRGTSEYNLGLGDRRANSVKRYLESLGIDPKRLEILSKGSTEAKQTGGDAEWAKDRRVDFVVLKK